MNQVLITGAEGFIGRNFRIHLEQHPDFKVSTHTKKDSLDSLKEKIKAANSIVHLAGVNRPSDASEFERSNVDLTAFIIDCIETLARPTRLIFASSTQAQLDNPYGLSKRRAEEALMSADPQALHARIYRLPGVFGKWCRPNYNSVVATFCNNVAHALPLTVNDPSAPVELVYIDDVVKTFTTALQADLDGHAFAEVTPSYKPTVSELASIISGFKENRARLYLPNVGCGLTRKLYATYLSHLPRDQFSYQLEERHDNRGRLFEVLKSGSAGQIFMSTTKPGITRGNHYHHTKVEKFCVISGRATIRFRHVEESTCFEYQVSGDKISVVDIPPGFTHSIENTGDTDAIVLFWASEIFQPENPDTYYLDVLTDEEA